MSVLSESLRVAFALCLFPFYYTLRMFHHAVFGTPPDDAEERIRHMDRRADFWVTASASSALACGWMYGVDSGLLVAFLMLPFVVGSFMRSHLAAVNAGMDPITLAMNDAEEEAKTSPLVKAKSPALFAAKELLYVYYGYPIHKYLLNEKTGEVWIYHNFHNTHPQDYQEGDLLVIPGVIYKAHGIHPRFQKNNEDSPSDL